MRERAEKKVQQLQDSICEALAELDGKARFREDRWRRDGGGGGRTRIIENGALFEKGGVNVSTVYGALPPDLQASLRGDGEEFFATGVSLVLHPVNPHVPTTHANFRYIQRGDVAWFGGGADLTPYVLYDDDATHFHDVLAASCDRHDAGFYPRFKTWCDEYFFLPHRGEARGVGGLFFDDLTPDAHGGQGCHDWESLFAFWEDCGGSFLSAYVPLAERRRHLAYDDALRHWQLVRRGRYVEFNLVYDRGTLFGLKTNGRVESILMSLPPLVRWDYCVEPEPGTGQARLIEAVRAPREWRTTRGHAEG